MFAALGGLALTAASGQGDPHAGDIYTLNSVAAVVLGGVSLLGGVGGLIGPIVAAFVLTLVKAILIIRGEDPNYGAGDPGHADRARRDDRRPRGAPEGEGRMSSVPSSPSAASLQLRRRLADNPAITLSFVFVALFVATDIVNRAQGGRRS